MFLATQEVLGLPRGTIKATVLIETIPAVFEMDEILNELREHAVGLNCGRWDHVFSFAKTFRHHPDFLLPDRAAAGDGAPFFEVGGRSAGSDLSAAWCPRDGSGCRGTGFQP